MSEMRKVVIDPLIDNNPVTLQMLGIGDQPYPTSHTEQHTHHRSHDDYCVARYSDRSTIARLRI